MRFSTRLSLASGVLILGSVGFTAFLANRSFQRVYSEQAASTVETAQAYFNEVVDAHLSEVVLTLRPLQNDSRIFAGFQDPSRSFLQQGGGHASIGDQRDFLGSWVDDLYTSLDSDLLLLVNQDLKLVLGLDSKGAVGDGALQSRQVQTLIGAVGNDTTLMLWSGPRLRAESPVLGSMGKGLYLAGVGKLIRDAERQDRMVLGVGIVAQSKLPFDRIAQTGADAVFVDKDQVLLQTFEHAGVDPTTAHARALAARDWINAKPAGGLAPISLAGTPYWAKPLQLQNLVPGPVHAALFYSREPEMATRSATRNAVLAAAAVMFVLGLALALYQVRDLSRPVLELASAAEQVGKANLEVKVSEGRRDELGELAHRFNAMVGGLKERELAKSALGKYLSPEMARALLESGDAHLMKGERRELTVLFSDVAGFTTLSERLQPEQVVSFLNQYLDRMVPILFRHHAYVDKFEGDAIMAFWNAPVPLAQHAAEACVAAIEMRAAFELFAREWEAKGYPGLAVRWGLNTGEVVVGNMGSSEKVNYTAIGDEVNLASRLEGTNKMYRTQLIASEYTEALARGVAEFRELDQIRVKGKKAAVRIFEILDLKGSLDPARAELRTRYQEGLGHYRARRFEAAQRSFQDALAHTPGDGPSAVMLERCQLYLSNAPPDDWDGVFTMTEK